MPTISKFAQNLKNIAAKEDRNTAISLQLCEKHDRCKPGSFNPLKLVASHRSNERVRLRGFLARHRNAVSLNVQSLVPGLVRKSWISHAACVNQILNDYFDLCWLPDTPFLQFNCQHVGSGVIPDHRISRGMLLNPSVTLGWLRNPQNVKWDEVFTLLSSAHHDAPWLPATPTSPGFFAFQDRYPRAKALVYLHATFTLPHEPGELPLFLRSTLAMDRSAGRLYLLAHLLSQLPDGFSICPNTQELPGTYPCTQLSLSNFP